jgi:HEAT repeat protein
MSRSIALIILLALVVSAVPCAGEGPEQKGRERYEKQTKGANIDEYVRRLNSDDPEKRLEAVKSLEGSKDRKAVEYLVQALGDSDVRVRAKAIDALGNLRAREASPVLIQQLFLRNVDPTVKQRLLASLGKIGDERAAGSIVEFMQRDLDPATRGTAIFALGEIGAAEALPALTDIEKNSDDPTLRRLAAEASSRVRYHQALIKTEAKEPQNTFLKDEKQPPQE